MLKLFGALVLLGLVLACITSWVLDSYDTAWHPKRSVQNAGDADESKGAFAPFPGGELSNIFWFIQVRYRSVSIASWVNTSTTSSIGFVAFGEAICGDLPSELSEYLT